MSPGSDFIDGMAAMSRSFQPRTIFREQWLHRSRLIGIETICQYLRVEGNLVRIRDAKWTLRTCGLSFLKEKLDHSLEQGVSIAIIIAGGRHQLSELDASLDHNTGRVVSRTEPRFSLWDAR